MKRLLALCCALALLLTCAACGGGGSPKQTVAAFFDAAKTIDIEGMNACLAEDQALTWDLDDPTVDHSTPDLAELLRTLAAKLDYTLDNLETSGSAAAADVTVRYADASFAVRDAMTDVMADLLATLFGAETETDPEALLIEAIREKLETETLPEKTAQLTLRLEKTDGGWIITNLPDEMINMMTGNAVTAFENAVESLTGK